MAIDAREYLDEFPEEVELIDGNTASGPVPGEGFNLRLVRHDRKPLWYDRGFRPVKKGMTAVVKNADLFPTTADGTLRSGGLEIWACRTSVYTSYASHLANVAQEDERLMNAMNEADSVAQEAGSAIVAPEGRGIKMKTGKARAVREKGSEKLSLVDDEKAPTRVDERIDPEVVNKLLPPKAPVQPVVPAGE